jgi:hypothetical protein
MSNTKTTVQLAAPPPRPMISRLSDGTGAVGWIGDGRLGFTGFATLGHAATAAWVAHVALERRRAKSRREPAPHIEPKLELLVTGNEEWLTIEGKRVARLLSPAPASELSPTGIVPPGEAWFGFELVFPADVSSFEIESSAHVVYRAVRRSGVGWPMRANGSTDSPLPRSTVDAFLLTRD